MKQTTKVRLVMGAIALMLAMLGFQCRQKNCRDCITPNPVYTLTAKGVEVDPGPVTNVSEVQITVKNATTDSVLFNQSVLPNQRTLVPLLPGPQGLRFLLHYTMLRNAQPYCDHGATLRTDGGPIMDVVMMLQAPNPKECNPTASKPLHPIAMDGTNQCSLPLSASDLSSGLIYFTACGETFSLLPVMNGDTTELRLYPCGENASGGWTTLSNHLVEYNNGGVHFRVEVVLGTSGLPQINLSSLSTSCSLFESSIQ